jgi:glycosyltransferase involved in cell wall biosynthesis
LLLNLTIPCYNPPEGWETALAERYAAFCAAAAPITQNIALTVVNDGSPRNVETAHLERLQQLIPGVNIVHYAENRGKGYALRQGIQASQADIYVVTDTDFPYTLDSMCRVAETALKKGGIAAGNRDTGYYAHVPFFRRVLSKGLRWMLRNLLRQPIGDSQCGLKAFDNAGKDIFLHTTIDRFLFDLEFLMIANGRVPVTPVPVELREGVVFSKVGYKILMTEGRNFLRLLIKKR